ncbi:major facilitator superfamily domain-containing protein [Pisolithus sp. B1]|nr:major facilitator superfamily domain-containing protein [Pisolithus sp. B1]
MPTSEKSVQCGKVQYAPTSLDNDSGPEDRRITRKVDLRLLPILTLLYLLSFLDRSNIGNAKLLTFGQDLGISAPAYNTALAIYFVGYVIFEVPSNVGISISHMHLIHHLSPSRLTSVLRLKRFDPQFWLPSLILTWGIVSIFQGLVKNQAGLFGIRFLLGATEAGLFPGVVYVFSVYYQRRQRSWRVAIFLGGAALAGAFGGIFAYAIGLMNGVGGRKGCQWIFILEGILTVIVSLIAYFLVPTWSHKAKFVRLHKNRVHLLKWLRVDSDAGTNQTFQWSSVGQAFGDHLVWAYPFLFHGFSFVLYSLSLFLSTIIADLASTTVHPIRMMVPPNALASFSIRGTVWLSSRWNFRAPFIIVAARVAIIGYIILLTCTTPGLQYFGIHLVTAGVYTGNSLLLRFVRCRHDLLSIITSNLGGWNSWPGENVSGKTKRAVAVALQITVGDIAAIAGCLLHRPSLSAHLYRKPNLIAIGYLLFAILATCYLWIMMAWENRKTDAIGGGNSQLL